jgi:protease-4
MAEGRGIEAGDIQSFADDYVGFFGEAAIGNIAYAKANNIIDGTKVISRISSVYDRRIWS